MKLQLYTDDGVYVIEYNNGYIVYDTKHNKQIEENPFDLVDYYTTGVLGEKEIETAFLKNEHYYVIIDGEWNHSRYLKERTRLFELLKAMPYSTDDEKIVTVDLTHPNEMVFYEDKDMFLPYFVAWDLRYDGLENLMSYIQNRYPKIAQDASLIQELANSVADSETQHKEFNKYADAWQCAQNYCVARLGDVIYIALQEFKYDYHKDYTSRNVHNNNAQRSRKQNNSTRHTRR